MRRRVRLLVAAVILGGLLPVVSVSPVLGADATVSATCDETEFDAALAFVQGSGGGTLTIDCGNGFVLSFTTEKFITTDVVLDGGQANLDANALYRHFTINAGASLMLQSVELLNGSDSNGGSVYVDGGTLLAQSGTTRIRNNIATIHGGGIYNDGGLVEIRSSAVVSSNVASNDGGGIYNDGGTVRVLSGSVASNDAIRGGGIFNNGGVVDLELANVARNRSTGSGGGIENASGGTVTIRESSQVYENEATGSGGGVQNEGLLNVSRSQIYGNESTADSGGGINNAAGGTVTISHTTLYSNIAATRGGGLRNGSGFASIDTSTISNNTATGNQGGGILNQDQMTILNSTIAFNTSGTGGGGIRNNGSLNSGNTIYASNIGGGDCSAGVSGVFTSLGHNLDTDASCPFTELTDISGGNAALGPLGPLGGVTVYHLPGPGSDAIDAGPASCTSPDQRGEFRPRNGACEIGSIEIVPPPDVCYNAYTRVLQAAFGGACNGTHLIPVVFEEFGPHYLCSNLQTGMLSYSFAPTCAPYNIPAIVMPAASPLPVCLKYSTGQYRWLRPGRSCTYGEYGTTLS